MILNNNNISEAEYIGDIQENVVGIDSRNIGFITQLLTSNLYSRPLESFLRETVANAYDSHIEAGTDEYIIMCIEELDYGAYSSKFKISIRDFGTGLSPERFDTVYKNIGSSTKRESNDFIGMMGIGRLSALSVVDVANVTSYYNNVKYSYLMYKNNGGINIDKMSETPGEYKDGMEIMIECSVRDYDLRDAICKLALFDKLHIEYISKSNRSYVREAVENFNERVIKRFKHFTYCSLMTNRNMFSMGNILYEGSYSINTLDTRVILNIPIGDADITPSREQLQFTARTNKACEDTIASAKNELGELVLNKISNTNLTLQEFFIMLDNENISIDDCGTPIILRDIDTSILKKAKIKIGGDALPDNYAAYINKVKSHVIDRGWIYMTSSMRNKYCSIKDILGGYTKICFKKDAQTKAITKFWFSQEHKGERYLVIKDFEKPEIIFSVSGISNIDECVEFTMKHLDFMELRNSDVPEDFKEAFKLQKDITDDSGVEISLENLPCRKYYDYGWRNDKINIKYWNVIFYTTNTTDDADLKSLCSILHVRNLTIGIITVKAALLPLLENNSKCVNIANITLHKNNLISKIATYWKIKHNFSINNECYCSNLISEFRQKYADYEYGRLYPHGKFAEELLNLYIDNGWVNTADIKYFTVTDAEKKLLKYVSKLRENMSEIIDTLAYTKFGKNERMGYSRPKVLLSKYL